MCAIRFSDYSYTFPRISSSIQVTVVVNWTLNLLCFDVNELPMPMNKGRSLMFDMTSLSVQLL